MTRLATTAALCSRSQLHKQLRQPQRWPLFAEGVFTSQPVNAVPDTRQEPQEDMTIHIIDPHTMARPPLAALNTLGAYIGRHRCDG